MFAARALFESRAPAVLWIAEPVVDGLLDVRRSPGGARDGADWSGLLGGVEVLARTGRPGMIARGLTRLGVPTRPPELVSYDRTPWTRPDETGRTWRGVVRWVDLDEATCPAAVVGRWEIRRGAARDVVELCADGAVRDPRWLGRWGVVGDVLILEAAPVRASYASPGARALLDADGERFEGRGSAEIGAFAGRRLPEE
jgi:hypothetical protein